MACTSNVFIFRGQLDIIKVSADSVKLTIMGMVIMGITNILLPC